MTTRSACTGSLLELQVLSHWLKQPWEKIMKKKQKNLCPENSQTVLNRKQDSQWVTLLAWGLFKIEMCRGHKQIYTWALGTGICRESKGTHAKLPCVVVPLALHGFLYSPARPSELGVTRLVCTQGNENLEVVWPLQGHRSRWEGWKGNLDLWDY